MTIRADVGLLLEGSYPFVQGGVSSWVHQLISGLPDVRFALVFLGGRRPADTEPKYALPPNVVHLETHYLAEACAGSRPRRGHCSRHDARRLEAFHAHFEPVDAHRDDSRGSSERVAGHILNEVLATLGRPNGLRLEQFLFSSEAWEYIRESHFTRWPNAAFVDYFWTLRQMHAPLFHLARIADTVVDAHVYHSVSTGYAGLLGALLALRRDRPFVLTEHGIYTKERQIDLNQAEWIDQLRPHELGAESDTTLCVRQLWMRFFDALGRIAYRSANPIVSLYAGNRERQHQDGADPARTRVIVNGIPLDRYAKAFGSRPQNVPPIVGLIGRVVPIKDVKTFIHTITNVTRALPDAQGWVIGAHDEDPAYANECQALARAQGLEGRLRFLGHQDVMAILPQLGLVMLTSISEGQPLAVLEAFAAGVPCVTTDVGGCREQIEGGSADDRSLGKAGRVVPFADANALAAAAIELLTDERAWRACQAVGLERVRRYYAVDSMLESYREIYSEALEGASWQALGSA